MRNLAPLLSEEDIERAKRLNTTLISGLRWDVLVLWIIK